MIRITDSIVIDEEAIQIKHIYASGPGGQHINKNMTAIQVHFNILQCHSLPNDVQQRLIQLAGSRINNEYQLVITARNHRSQDRNRKEALLRLYELIRKAAKKPKLRRKKNRSKLANKIRVKNKRKHGQTKSLRKKILT